MTKRIDVVVGSAERLAADFTRLTSALAADAIRERRRFTLAIPGGSVVERLISFLPEAPIDWSRVDLFWCDERCVPPTDPESNFAAAQRYLLNPIAPPGPRVYRMRGEDEDQVLAARLYATELESTLGTPPRLDLVVLGVGEDGHVCSLFPGHRALNELVDWVVVEPASPKPPPVRLTMTLPMIAAARHVVAAAFGSAKAPVVREALEDAEVSALPIALALRNAAWATVYLDDAAASMLKRDTPI
ncbi:MAG: 6-phosphogluconolactonase [Gemmatimonadaceae bacterium]